MQGLPNQCVGHVGSVVLRRVDVVDTKVDGTPQHGHRRVVVPGGPNTPGPGSCIAPKPMRLTVWGPSEARDMTNCSSGSSAQATSRSDRRLCGDNARNPRHITAQTTVCTLDGEQRPRSDAGRRPSINPVIGRGRTEGCDDGGACPYGKRHRCPFGDLGQSIPLVRGNVGGKCDRPLDRGRAVVAHVIPSVHLERREVPLLALGVHAQRHRGTGDQGAEEKAEWRRARVAAATGGGLVGEEVMDPACRSTR